MIRALGLGFIVFSASFLLLNLVFGFAEGASLNSAVVGTGLAALLIGLAFLAVPGDD